MIRRRAAVLFGLKFGVGSIEQHLVVIGEVVYEPAKKLLARPDGQPVSLRAQSVHVLEFLLDNAGTVVSREEIFANVWPDVAVTDDSLTQCISEIRRTIGDSKRSILQTIPKRGYLLSTESTVTGSGDRSADPLQFEDSSSISVYLGFDSDRAGHLLNAVIDKWSDRSQVTPAKDGAHLEFTDIVAALDCMMWVLESRICCAGIDRGANAPRRARELATHSPAGVVRVSMAFRDSAQLEPRVQFENTGFTDRDPDNGAAEPVFSAVRVSEPTRFEMYHHTLLPTIAILPMVRAAGEHRDEHIGMLFAHAITRELSRSNDAHVVSSLSTTGFQMRNPVLSDVRRLLGADFVLSGHWIAQQASISFACEFTDTRTGHVLWSNTVESSLSELTDGVDAVQEVVNQIRKSIVLNETQKVQYIPFRELGAYSILYGAIGLLHRFSRQDFLKARDLLDHLIQLGLNHPAPLAWMARWHLLKVVQGWSDDPDHDGELALTCTARALDIDPGHTLAMVSEGQVLTVLKRRFDDAEYRYDAALDANPNDANGRMLRAMLLAFTDRGEEGLADANRSLHLSPLDPHRFMNLALAAGVNLSIGDNETALDLARASYRLNRTHTSTLRMLAVLEARCGNLEKSVSAKAELLQIQPGLRVSEWLKNSPSASYRNGQQFAQDLRAIGIPE